MRAIPVQNDTGTDLGPSVPVGTGGWGGDNATFAVNNHCIYAVKDDHLYGADLRLTTSLGLLRPEGDWHGQIVVADGVLFLQRDDDLFVAKIDNLNVHDLRHVDNGSGFKDGPIAFYASNGYLYHMAPSDDGSSWNLYARSIDAASAHVGSSWQPLHATNWYGAIAIGVLRQPPAWWETIEASYMDHYGLVRDRPLDPSDPNPGDNDLLSTSWYYIARKLNGPWDDSLVARFNSTVRRCRDQSGLFFRHPDEREYTAFDDYLGLITASYICDPQKSVAKDIMSHGLSHGGAAFSDFVYGRVGNDLRTLWARPWLISFLATATNERDQLILPERLASDSDFIGDITTGTDFIGLTQPGTENPAFAWMQLRIADDPNTPGDLRDALRGYRSRFRSLYPNGMEGALTHWSSGWAMHPLAEGFRDVV